MRIAWHRRRTRERARIVRLEDSTCADPRTGAVRSAQCADLLIAQDALAEIWTPAHLERLARTYWRFLTRVTLGLVRVRYEEHGRSIVLLCRPFRLLSFDEPEYEMDGAHGLVRWRIARGLLVSRRGRDGHGYLQIEVRRELPALAAPAPASAEVAEAPAPTELGDAPVALHVEVAVANFYPSIASRLSLRIYNATQSRLHVIVTYGFLRSLRRLDLAESQVGALREPTTSQAR